MKPMINQVLAPLDLRGAGDRSSEGETAQTPLSAAGSLRRTRPRV